MKTHKDFLEFLKTVDLISFRQKYAGYKSVEEDLPRNCQILNHIYKVYWVDRNFLPYEEFIKEVIKELEGNLRTYNLKRNNHDQDAEAAYPMFLKGWIARQYRTWTSIITQIQLGYLAEQYFPNNEVLMSAELDAKGIDIRIIGLADIGVKKVSARRDITILGEEKEGVVPIKYWVPSSDVLQNPRTKKGKIRKPYLDFKQDTRLDYLPNGFIVFTEEVFNDVIQ